MPVSQRNLATCLLTGGGLLAMLSQITQVALPLGERRAPVLLMCFGLLVYLTGILVSRSEQISDKVESVMRKPSQWFGIEPWQVFSVFLSIFFAVLAHYAAGELGKMISPVAAWVAWLISIGACLIGFWKPNELDLRSKWKLFALALGLTLIALPFRAFNTNNIPVILNGDEGSAGLFGVSFLKGEVNNIFFSGWYSFPSLYFLIPAASISLFGQTTAALRIPSAIAGALTVGGVYLTGHAMYGKRTGLIAALALAGFHHHIHFSRIGLNNIWDGLFFIITVGAAWYAWENENRTAYILAGLGLGLSQYFYPSSRVILIVVFGGILISGLFAFSRLKRSIPNILLMSWIMGIIFLPLAWFYFRYPDQYFAPMERVSIIGDWLTFEMQITNLPAWKILLKQIILGIQAFTFIDLQAWYRPEVPFLRPLYACLFILGFMVLLSRPKDSRTISLLIWVLIYIPLGGLSESTPAAQRYVAAAPVCILILAHGLDETGAFFERLWQKSSRTVTIVLLAIVVALAADDINFYFNKYTPHTVIEFGRNDGVTAQGIADELERMPKGTQAFFLSNPAMGYYSIPSIPYLAPQVEGIDAPSPWSPANLPAPTSEHLVFIFHPSNINDVQAIQDAYPGGKLLKRNGVDGEMLFWIYEYNVAQ